MTDPRSAEIAATPCGCADPDEPCTCTPPEPRQTHAIRPSAEYVAQVRAMGDRRFPLRALRHDHDCSLHTCWRDEEE